MRTFLPVLFLSLPFWAAAQAYEFAQQTLPLTDLSAFKPAKSNWKIVRDATVDITKDDVLTTTAGTGILVNNPDAKNRDNLVFGFEHGDLDLEMEVMMARNSNSGIYLQGRYEIQLFDSWGKRHPTSADMGGVYGRSDEVRKTTYEGIPPRLNAAYAPGLWQTLRIAFQAPRFDGAGRKIANARLLRVELNGMIIHENVELKGPTAGQAFPGEAALGPILIQGDHGPVAFRNIRYRTYTGQPAQLRNLKYRYFSGEYGDIPDFSKLKADGSGDLAQGLTWEVAKGNNDFALQYTGTLYVPESGKYNLVLTSFGNGSVKIDNNIVIKPDWWVHSAAVDLSAGEHTLEVAYAKRESWTPPSLGLTIEGQNFRPTPFHIASSAILSEPTAPILLKVGNEPELLRSFIDLPPMTREGRSKRIVHPISVGFPQAVSYSYDLDNGTLMQVWHGDFLDATPMWHDRGDGHAEPLGAVLRFGDAPQFAKNGSPWPDTIAASSGYHFMGYNLDSDGVPTYSYTIHGLTVQDKITPAEDGKILRRELKIEGATAGDGVQFRVGKGTVITQVTPDTWAIGDKSYYIQLPAKVKPVIRTVDGGQEMLLPLDGDVRYNVQW